MRYAESHRQTVLLLLLWAAVMAVPSAALACAVCGDGPGTPGDPIARGFYWGVVFLMATPFTIFGAVGGWIAYQYWRAGAVCRGRSPLVSLWAKVRAARPAFLQSLGWKQKESES